MVHLNLQVDVYLMFTEIDAVDDALCFKMEYLAVK